MGYDATYVRLGLAAVFDLKAAPDPLRAWAGEILPAFPRRPNSMVTEGSRALCLVGPQHWLLRAEIAEEDALIAALKPAEAPPQISIVQVSDTVATFQVTGPDATEIMAVACPLDLHPSVFAEDACTMTEVFTLRGCVWRCPHGFAFTVEQSFGDMVEDYLQRTIGAASPTD